MSRIAEAYVQIVPTMSGATKALEQEFANVGGPASRSFGATFAGGIKGLAGPIAAAFSVAAVANFAQASLDAARAETEQNARINEIADSMGVFGAEAGKVSKRLIDLAAAQALSIGLDEDTIKNTQAKLLTFKELADTADESGGAFDRATMAAMDMAAAGFGTAESNAVALGKALNDPILGISSLSRMGVQFSDEQQAMISSLVETGDVAAAQQIILSELETQVGGTAAATATEADRMAQAWANVQESVGLLLLPVMEDLATFISDTVLPAVTEFIDWAKENPGILQAVGIALGVVAAAFAVLTAAMWLASLTPISLMIAGIVVAIGLLVAAVVWLISNWDAVVAWFGEVWAGFTGWLSESFAAIGEWWNGLWAGIQQFVEDTWNGIVAWFGEALQWLVDLFLNWTLLGQIIQNWDAIVKVFTDTWNGIVSWFDGAIAGFVEGWETAWAGIGTFISDTFNNIVNFVKAPLNFIIGLINSVIDGVNGLKIDIPSWVPLVGGQKLGFNIPKLPMLADGGVITGSGSVIVGEAGPEMLTLPRGARVDPLSSSSSSSDRPIYMDGSLFGVLRTVASGEAQIVLNTAVDAYARDVRAGGLAA